MLNIQKFLKTHNYIDLMEAPYFLKIKERGNLILFNYTIHSSTSNIITQEARGLVLEKNTWNVIRMGFYRFFNVGEKECASIDWETCYAKEKLDGTLIFLYYYDEEWKIGTRNTIDAKDAPLENVKYNTFKDLFYDIIKIYSNFDFTKLNKNCTYCLEMCSIYNTVVVEYKEPKLFHILTRNNTTLEELDVDIGIPKPKAYFLENENEYKELVNSFDETHEGIVLQDKYNHRAKLKSPLYFELHRLAANHQITVEMVINKIRTGEDSEFLAYFGTEYSALFEKIRNELTAARDKVINVIKRVELWESENPWATRKDFSDFVKTQEYSPIWYVAYDKNAQEWFDKLNDKKLIALFHIGEEM